MNSRKTFSINFPLAFTQTCPECDNEFCSIGGKIQGSLLKNVSSFNSEKILEFDLGYV